MPKTNNPFFEKNKWQFVLIPLYLVFIFLCAPICFAFFLSSIISPLFVKLHKTFRIHYHILIVLFSALLFSIACLGFYYFATHGEAWALASYRTIEGFLKTLEELPYVSYVVAPIQQGLLQLVSKLVMSLQMLIHYVFDVLIFFIAFYFSLVEARRNPYWYFIYVPSKFRAQWQQFFHDALNMFVRYFTIELRLVAITMAMLSLGFWLLQFPHPIIKAMLLAIFDCIPFFGISLVLIPLAIYFAIVDQLAIALGILLLLIVTIVMRQLFDAYFWSSTVKIKTIHTFFISGVSFMIFGLYGILVSPILLLVVMKLKLHYGRF